jgi:hypothetical protein
VEERSLDCPVAIITPKSEELLNIFGRASRVHDASGAALFGPAIAEWPIWAVDAQDQIRVCEIQENNARIEAEMMER